MDNRNPLGYRSAPPPQLATNVPGSIDWTPPITVCRNCDKMCRSCGHELFHIELGCGVHWRKIKRVQRAIALDALDFGQPVRHNLEWTLPFPPQFAHSIAAVHVFEHVDDIHRLLCDCWRILRFGGTLDIVVPCYLSENAPGDLTHVRGFSAVSLNYCLGESATNHPIIWPYPPFNLRQKIHISEHELAWYLEKGQ